MVSWGVTVRYITVQLKEKEYMQEKNGERMKWFLSVMSVKLGTHLHVVHERHFSSTFPNKLSFEKGANHDANNLQIAQHAT